MTLTRQALRGYFPDGGWARRVQPLPAHRLVYVRNAKAGTSTVLLWLHRLHTGDLEFTTSTRSIHGVHELPTVGEVGAATVAHMLDGDAFRFSFVRDPVARVESAYRDKIVRQRHPRERRTLVQRTLGLPEDPDAIPSFDQFIDAIEIQAREPRRMDVHWRPQHLNLMHPLVTYDLVGRVETFDADLSRIADAVGAPWMPMPPQNTTGRGSSLFDGRDDLLRRVRQVYACDYELYGY